MFPLSVEFISPGAGSKPSYSKGTDISNCDTGFTVDFISENFFTGLLPKVIGTIPSSLPISPPSSHVFLANALKYGLPAKLLLCLA